MKVIVQIPCYNEENTLAETLANIPREIEGVDCVEILIVDDGSRDRTREVARENNVDHIVRHRCNRGLAATFRTGLKYALQQNADIIVNTDGDNQYPGQDIPRLIEPIMAGRADVVIGDRQVKSVRQFSWTKRILSHLGSAVVRRLSGVQVPDAVSGFRAISRDAATKINIISSFSYTIEMLIQIGHKRLALETIPIQINPKLRKSRLFRSIPQFIAYSGATLLRIYAMARPFRFFFTIGMLLVLLGLLPIARFLFFYFTDSG
ncbi:glycosyltransferase family 2 protein, partial [Magnetococcales bacterium HHB-1]